MRLSDNSVIIFEAGKAKHKPPLVFLIIIFPTVFLISYIVSNLITYLPLVIANYGRFAAERYPSGGVKSIFPLVSDYVKHPPQWFGALSSTLPFILSTVMIILYCRKIEMRPVSSMGLRSDNLFKHYFKGYAIGILMMTATVGLSIAFNGTALVGINSGVSASYIALMLVHYIVQGMSEEVAFRGYFMVSCANRTSAAAAVIISSVVFAAFHLANIGMTVLAFVNLTLYGIFAALYILRTDDLWGACALHSAWNFFQGNIYGIAVSGAEDKSSVFRTLGINGQEFISGGSFGIEGGICTTVVMAVGIALLLYLPQKPRPALTISQGLEK